MSIADWSLRLKGDVDNFTMGFTWTEEPDFDGDQFIIRVDDANSSYLCEYTFDANEAEALYKFLGKVLER